MKAYLLTTGILFGLMAVLRADEVAAQETLPSAPVGFTWLANPELSDEFNAQQLDATKWLPYQPYWQGREPSHFEPENVMLGKGMLQLRSTTLVTNMAEVKNPGTDVWVHSACVSSKQPVAFYGYYEARIKASRLSMTSSFWFQGKYSEIDVVEELGASRNHPEESRLMLMNSHYFQGSWKEDKATPERWQMPSGAADGFHVYGVWWKDKDTIWFYHDGKKVAEMKTGGAFLEPMYLFFDTEVFAWEGLPTVESLQQQDNNTMYVDWVHAWRLVENGKGHNSP
jgi:beta-glucanase (GH16 family)